MSLVEKALQKILAQQAQAPEQTPGRPPRANPPINVPVEAAPMQRPAPTFSFSPPGPRVDINIAKLREAGLVPSIQQERVATRQMRNLKHSLIRKLANDKVRGETVHRTVMVTSARSGDGKTFTTLNLALSLALEKDLRVLLVDADVPKPNISTIFGATNQRGLIDVLADNDSDPASVICPTSVNGLYFAPVGRSSEVATELLSSGRMAQVVQRWVSLEPRMLVLFDSPPMLVTAESQALSALMSQILVVVRAGVTLQSAVKETLALLAVGGGHLSLVLNDSAATDSTSYGYGYGYNQQQSETPNASS